MSKKVLIFPCGSEIGLELHQALKWSTHVELYGASTVPNHGKFVYKNYIEGIPDVSAPDFIERVNDVIKKYEIDFLFPAHDSVILELLRHQKTLLCPVISSPLASAEICRSKKKTYEYFFGKIPVPSVYATPEEIANWPVFLKPEIGQGSRGVFIADSEKDVRFYLEKDPSLLILEFLPGKEYTVDCFTDSRGVLRFVGPRERARINNGISVATKTIEEGRLNEIAEIINSELQFRGVWFFQVKENAQNEFSLLEIAPRVSGSMATYRNKGINFALLSIFDALGKEVNILPNAYNVQMDRALTNRFILRDLPYKHVYIDFDDTVIFNGAVNSFVMMFLFQALNQGVKLHLLSRHQERTGQSLQSVLNAHRLVGIFDVVIDVPGEVPKSRFITEKKSIFIDDSFAEREEVARVTGVPVFEVSMVESLINWRY